MQLTVIIVGAGLSGLYAAALLTKRGIACRVLEARDRIGGRVLTETVPELGSFDLGPTWFWPHFETTITRLINELGLETFDQYIDGAMLYEPTVHVPAERHVLPPSPESRAVRFAGGVKTLIEAVRASGKEGSITLGTRVTDIQRMRDGTVRVVARKGSGEKEVLTAHKVVLALPPRVVARDIAFDPPLPNETVAELGQTPTWMAGQAKVIAVFDEPFWRADELSGFVSSRVGPLQEIHDASPPDGSGALFGFFGWTASERQALGKDAVEEAVRAQLIRLFGEKAAYPVSLLYHDWATEIETATESDLPPLREFPAYGSPPLSGEWDDALAFAGTEASEAFGGHLEGALWAAEVAVDKVFRTL